MTLFGRAGAALSTLLLVVSMNVFGGTALAATAAPVSRTVTAAVADVAAYAATRGVTQYISVVDRATGKPLAQTANAAIPVQSESIIKLLIAAYYLVQSGGPAHTSAAIRGRLAYMLEYSDDATASALFRTAAIPTIAKRYGLQHTSNAPGTPGRWGSAQISAADMTLFLSKAAADPLVGPWLLPVMARTAPRGSDGFDQFFGLNVLTGVHGSKQGWGRDTATGPRRTAIHSVGFTDRYFVAILQLSGGPSAVSVQTATHAARLIAAAMAVAPPDGTFVRFGGVTYRMAGGAPIRVASWAAVGGVQKSFTVGKAVWEELAAYPADGAFVRAGAFTYRMAGGAPIRVASWAAVGGVQPATVIDPAAIAHADGRGPWNHLRQYPVDGTFLRGGSSTYQVTGGVPTRISSWAAVGGVQPATVIDPAAIAQAGGGGAWNHLRMTGPA